MFGASVQTDRRGEDIIFEYAIAASAALPGRPISWDLRCVGEFATKFPMTSAMAKISSAHLSRDPRSGPLGVL